MRFEPLPILPTSDLKSQIGESEKVWANIQQSVQESKKVAEEKSMVLKREDLPKGEIVDMSWVNEYQPQHLSTIRS